MKRRTVLTALLAAISLSVGCMQMRTREAHTSTDAEAIAALFDRWNEALQSGDPEKVVDCYAETSILLPTVSNTPRLTRAEKLDYFVHFLENRPSGTIDRRWIWIDNDTAVDAGLYTFHFAETGTSVSGRFTFTYRREGNDWRITSHHSSAMPE